MDRTHIARRRRVCRGGFPGEVVPVCTVIRLPLDRAGPCAAVGRRRQCDRPADANRRAPADGNRRVGHDRHRLRTGGRPVAAPARATVGRPVLDRTHIARRRRVCRGGFPGEVVPVCTVIRLPLDRAGPCAAVGRRRQCDRPADANRRAPADGNRRVGHDRHRLRTGGRPVAAPARATVGRPVLDRTHIARRRRISRIGFPGEVIPVCAVVRLPLDRAGSRAAVGRRRQRDWPADANCRAPADGNRRIRFNSNTDWIVRAFTIAVEPQLQDSGIDARRQISRQNQGDRGGGQGGIRHIRNCGIGKINRVFISLRRGRRRQGVWQCSGGTADTNRTDGAGRDRHRDNRQIDRFVHGRHASGAGSVSGLDGGRIGGDADRRRTRIINDFKNCRNQHRAVGQINPFRGEWVVRPGKRKIVCARCRDDRLAVNIRRVQADELQLAVVPFHTELHPADIEKAIAHLHGIGRRGAAVLRGGYDTAQQSG